MFPWSAGTLIPVLTLHLYQRGSNSLMISIVYVDGVCTQLCLGGFPSIPEWQNCCPSKKGWLYRWLIKAPRKKVGTTAFTALITDLMSPQVFSPSGRRSLQRWACEPGFINHHTFFSPGPTYPILHAEVQTHGRLCHTDLYPMILELSWQHLFWTESTEKLTVADPHRGLRWVQRTTEENLHGNENKTT